MNLTVEARVINTLQHMIDNAKLQITVYEDGDQQVLPIENNDYLYENGAVKVPNTIMLWDEEENCLLCSGAQEVYDFLDDCSVFDSELNCSKQQLSSVLPYFKRLGALVPEMEK